MKIKSTDLTKMHNDEHFQFLTEVKDLLAQYSGALTGTTLGAQFTECFTNEDTALRKIVKNINTENLELADMARDNTFQGLAASVKAALKHYNPQVVAAAKRLQIVFDTYGNIHNLPKNKETSAVYNLLQELTGNYAHDVKTLGIEGWVQQLETDNTAFESLVKQRNNEQAAASQLVMKECRAAINRVYYDIVERINALMLINGDEAYLEFVNKLNNFIDRYNNTMAQRVGRQSAKQE
jgi:hypothetical protein